MTASRRAVLGGAGAALIAASARADPARASSFLWGVATAAHVSEGQNINSDYWVLEHLPSTYFKSPSGDANDSFNRWRDDLLLAHAAGLNAYRFSVEWARIEPEPGEFSTAMLAHYRRICVACRELGMEPIVTFHHFTSPRWIAARGGWENPETADRFARYCEVAAKALAGSFAWANTLNEPNAQVTSYVVAGSKVGKLESALRAEGSKAIGSDRFHAFFMGDSFKVRDVCLAAHDKARDAIKAAAPGVKVGLALALQELRAGPGGEPLYRRLYQEARLPFYEAARCDDFIGVQAYNMSRTGPSGYIAAEPGEGFSDMSGYPSPPGAVTVSAHEAHRAAGVPVMITEHGFNSHDDALRIRHTRDSISGLAAAIDGGLPVLGYCHFTLVDTWEWSSAYGPRFGMASCDRVTFRRTPKPSLAAYRALIAETRRRHRWA